MSVLIKGFDKPDHCLRCPVKGIDDECLLQSEAANADYESWEDQMANCPLIPVPPHGRLIDADALIKTFHDEYDDEEVHGFEKGAFWFHGDVMNIVDSAPTIIPEEKAKEEKL